MLRLCRLNSWGVQLVLLDLLLGHLGCMLLGSGWGRLGRLWRQLRLHWLWLWLGNRLSHSLLLLLLLLLRRPLCWRLHRRLHGRLRRL